MDGGASALARLVTEERRRGTPNDAVAMRAMRGQVDVPIALDAAVFWAAVGAAYRELLERALNLLEGEPSPDALPLRTAALVNMLAGAAVPYPRGVALLQRLEATMTAQLTETAATLDLSGPEVAAVAKEAGSAVRDLFDGVIALAGARLRAASGGRDGEQSMLATVVAVLEGEEPDAIALGYALDVEHVAVVAWGSDADLALTALADVGAWALLKVATLDGTRWGWLGSATGFDLTALRRFRPPQDTRLAFGDPARGRAGFVLSHQQARAVLRITSRLDRDATFPRDVALELLALEDPDAARAFARRTLAPLRALRRAPPLEETLRAYFRAGENVTAAAADLDLGRRTVARRLQTVEEALDRPLRERRAELEAAFRIEAALDDD